MKAIQHVIKLTALAVAVLLPCHLMAGPIVVTINDVPNGSPVIQVKGAPNGYDIYTGEGITTPGIEDGALITLIGVNNYFEPGALPEWGGRFRDARPWESLPPLFLGPPFEPNINYREFVTAVDIVWVSHDADVFGLGDLQVGLNSRHPGGWYRNGGFFNSDEDLGPVTDNWVEVYTSDILVIRYKPHTYQSRDQGERPFKENGLISFTPASDLGGTFGVVGNATHLGKFVGKGTYQVTGASPDGLKVYFHVAATWTAANGDKLYLDMPQWVNDNSVTPPTSTGAANIIGGTGRFVNASGALFGEITPAVITPGVPNGLTMEGTITY